MVWFAAGILLCIVMIRLAAGKRKIPVEFKPSAVTKPFYACAMWLDEKLNSDAARGSALYRLSRRLLEKNEENLRLLEPAGDAITAARKQFVSKTALMLLILCAGSVFSLLMRFSEQDQALLGADGTLKRNGHGNGSYSLTLDAALEDEVYPGMNVTVKERGYSEAEIKEMLPDFHKALEEAVLGSGVSPDHVSSDIDPVSAVKGYPFYIEWEFRDHKSFDHNGKLKEDIPPEGQLLTLSAKVSLEDFNEIYSFTLMAYPPELSRRERLEKELSEAVSLADKESAAEEEFVLPSEVDGIKVIWDEKKKSSMAVLMFMIIAAAAGVCWGKDNDLSKKVKERDKQMQADYPELVSKLSLYMGAGMTTRTAWKKICSEYEKSGRKRYAYEEMLFTLREMESGVSELGAYQNFARRCRIQKYVKFVSLLEQNAKLGARGFLESLSHEAKDALEERKHTARQLGEEAGTKLLLPMVMMLAIVMVVIIVPAFMTM
ncbi:MAG: hypothetical protein IKI75_04005 [Lachnospiraceae bacterium]|nr:hypothetical protein [Lachnospiraceae bacterium]